MNNLSKVSNIDISNIDQITDTIITEKVVVNYDAKTAYMIDDKLKQSDINEFLNFMNYCFLVRNNFFIENFNVKKIKHVHEAYNQIKTNILDKDCANLFKDVDYADIKTVNFIVKNFINNYNNFMNINKKMIGVVSKDGMKRFKNFTNYKLKFMEQDI
jgi:hypothetical protein